jgi:hypothetical protein
VGERYASFEMDLLKTLVGNGERVSATGDRDAVTLTGSMRVALATSVMDVRTGSPATDTVDADGANPSSRVERV